MRLLTAAVLVLTAAFTAQAFAVLTDAPEQVAAVKRAARTAGPAIPRSTRGGVVRPDYAQTEYRNVRAIYKVNELVNDRITLCGEIDLPLMDGSRTGWIKFMWTPGDPNEFATERRDVGNIHQIGPEVRARYCDPAIEPFLDVDVTAEMKQSPPLNSIATVD